MKLPLRGLRSCVLLAVMLRIKRTHAKWLHWRVSVSRCPYMLVARQFSLILYSIHTWFGICGAASPSICRNLSLGCHKIMCCHKVMLLIAGKSQMFLLFPGKWFVLAYPDMGWQQVPIIFIPKWPNLRPSGFIPLDCVKYSAYQYGGRVTNLGKLQHLNSGAFAEVLSCVRVEIGYRLGMWSVMKGTHVATNSANFWLNVPFWRFWASAANWIRTALLRSE
jgi:hypothetical protein